MIESLKHFILTEYMYLNYEIKLLLSRKQTTQTYFELSFRMLTIYNKCSSIRQKQQLIQ